MDIASIYWAAARLNLGSYSILKLENLYNSIPNQYPQPIPYKIKSNYTKSSINISLFLWFGTYFCTMGWLVWVLLHLIVSVPMWNVQDNIKTWIIIINIDHQHHYQHCYHHNHHWLSLLLSQLYLLPCQILIS